MTATRAPETITREPDHERPAPSRTIARRVGLPNGRAVVGGLLMALAALGVFTAYAAANEDQTIAVYVAATDIAVGEAITEAHVTLVEIDPRGNGLGIYLPGGPLLGQYANSPIKAGEIIVDAVVTPAASWEPASEITLTIPATRALGGSVVVGQAVDVYVTWSRQETQLVAADATVLDVRAGGSGTLGGGSESATVRLELVDPTVIDALVHAQTHGEITLVRSTRDGVAGSTFTPPSEAGS